MPKLPDARAHAIRDVIASSETSFERLARVAGLNPECDFRYVVLRKVDFRGSDLSRFDFTGSHFERCSFVGARLGNATFTGAQFEGSQPGDEPYEHEYSELALEAPAHVEIGDIRQLEADLLHLEDDFTSPDWPLMFRRAWLTHGAEERLVALAIKWLKNVKSGAGIPVLLATLAHSDLKVDARDWLHNRALRLIQSIESTEPGWVRLWSQLLHNVNDRGDLLRLGAERLFQLAWERDRPPSRRIERIWTDVWKQLSRYGEDVERLARLSQDASEVFSSTSFAVTVLNQLPHSPHNLWAIRRLENWLFHSSAPDQAGFKVMATLLEINPIPEVITLGMNWLVAADPKVQSWARVWLVLGRHAPGEYLFSQGVKWLLTVNVRTSGWPDVLSEILQMDGAPRNSNELRQRTAEWLHLGREHRFRQLLTEFAGTIPRSASKDHENTAGKRVGIIHALERHFQVQLNEVSKNRFVSSNDLFRAVVRVSKRYRRFGGARYWYSYYDTVDQFLMRPGSFFVLGCMDREEAYAIPAAMMRSILLDLHQTRGSTSSYWHIDLIEDGGDLALLIPNRGTVPISEFRLAL